VTTTQPGYLPVIGLSGRSAAALWAEIVRFTRPPMTFMRLMGVGETGQIRHESVT